MHLHSVKETACIESRYSQGVAEVQRHKIDEVNLFLKKGIKCHLDIFFTRQIICSITLMDDK